MTIHSLYIYDRHCACVYYQDWNRSHRPKRASAAGLLPAVCRDVSADPTSVPNGSPHNSLAANSGVVVASVDDVVVPQASTTPTTSTGLPFDEETKLVYGVILSLRNMVRKLSGREEAFTSYRTNTYKLHVFETVSGYKFVMLGDPHGDSLRFVLRQIYIGPFLEYVVRNPLVIMDSRERGIDNEKFRTSVDRLIRGLTVFP